MPMVVQKQGRMRLSQTTSVGITRMSLSELITYEALLWNWMVKTQRSRIHCDDIVAQLNAIYREVEWRAAEAEWQDAAHT